MIYDLGYVNGQYLWFEDIFSLSKPNVTYGRLDAAPLRLLQWGRKYSETRKAGQK